MTDDMSKRREARQAFIAEYEKDLSRPSLAGFVVQVLPSHRGLTIGAVRLRLAGAKAGVGDGPESPLPTP